MTAKMHCDQCSKELVMVVVTKGGGEMIPKKWIRLRFQRENCWGEYQKDELPLLENRDIMHFCPECGESAMEKIYDLFPAVTTTQEKSP